MFKFFHGFTPVNWEQIASINTGIIELRVIPSHLDDNSLIETQTELIRLRQQRRRIEQEQLNMRWQDYLRQIGAI